MNRVDAAKGTGAYREWFRAPRPETNAPRVGADARLRVGLQTDTRTLAQIFDDMNRMLREMRVHVERRRR